MAQTLSLEEAAERLGITPGEMKKRLKTDKEFQKLGQIRDGSTVRFKLTAIDELARQLGMASDDGLPLAPLAADEPPGSDEFKVASSGDTIKKAPKKPAPADDAIDFGSTEDDVFSLADDAPKPGGPKSSGRLVPKAPKGASDSNVRLDNKGKKPAGGDEAAVPTEEIALDFGGPGSAVIKGGASSAKLSAPKSGNSSGRLDAANKGKPNKPDGDSDSSEFELSLDADSDDFDLQLNPDGGDEVDLGGLPKEKPGASAVTRGSRSGINLSDPADSGISLEKNKGPKTADAGKGKKAADADRGKKAGDSDKGKAKKKVEEDSDGSDLDFELSLDSSAVASSTKLGAPKSGKLVLDAESDSEFELTLDDSGGSLEQAALEEDILEDAEDKGDIFETDFEIPQMPDESASEAVALESDTDLEGSDFELETDPEAGEESGSEVVLLDDEEAPAKGKAKAKPAGPKGKKKTAVAEDEVDVDVDLADDANDASVSKALKGAKGKKKDADAEDAPAGAPAPTKGWGVVPLLFLMPASVFVLAGALMGYELLQTMWGYQQPRKPSSPIVRAIASQLDMELRDQ